MSGVRALRTCAAYGNERVMPPYVLKHCGRHMQFWYAPLLYWCPMCDAMLTAEQVHPILELAGVPRRAG